MNANLVLLIMMLMAALWTVISRSLLKATIGLALTSAIISVLIFRMNSPIAAVFELSVCTGLMTVIFVATISLTKPLTHKEVEELSRNRIKRFWYLPLIIVAAAAAIFFFFSKMKNDVGMTAPVTAPGHDVRYILWSLRQLDLFGQIIIIVAGALGVVILFEERNKDEW